MIPIVVFPSINLVAVGDPGEFLTAIKKWSDKNGKEFDVENP